MFNLRITTKVTFSFAKLNKKLDTILPQTIKRSHRDVANQWKQNIEDGDFAPLAPATRKRRKYKGYNPQYPKTTPRDTSTILQATGNLLKSIKATPRGVSFNKYGVYQHTNQPMRRWMSLKSTTTGRKLLSNENFKKLKTDIRKGFRLAGRGKNIRKMSF